MTARTTSAIHRVLLYAHDTYGLGHLRRNLAIATQLLSHRDDLHVVLMTGSSVADCFATPRGLALVQLPPVVKVGADDYRPRDPRWDIDLARRARSAIMSGVVRQFRPDILLVDHAPTGMKGELLPVYETIRESSPDTRIVLGLRDVLDDPATVERAWRDTGVAELLANVFDRVLVYGSKDVFDVVAGYGLAPDVASKVAYTGYISLLRQRSPAPAPDEGAYVLGTAGGGGDGVEILLATLSASRSLGVASLVVTGPLMSDADRQAVAAQAELDPRARVVEFVADMGAAMDRARAVVTMGGYNTMCELAARATPTIVVPRVHPRQEQAIRAELFARRGVVAVVTPGADLGPRLECTLARTLAAGHTPAERPLDLDGLDRVDALLEAEAARGRSGRVPLHRAARLRASA